MPTRIVTSTYRYKRPPRKKKPQAIAGPVIVTPRKRAPSPTDGPNLQPPVAPSPANDDGPEPGTPPQQGKKLAIVTTSKRGRRPKPEPEIDPEAEARVKAFVARMMRPSGTDG